MFLALVNRLSMSLRNGCSARGVCGERLREAIADDRGMSTVEYALGTLAAAALGGVLLTIVKSPDVMNAIQDIFMSSLENPA